MEGKDKDDPQHTETEIKEGSSAWTDPNTIESVFSLGSSIGGSEHKEISESQIEKKLEILSASSPSSSEEEEDANKKSEPSDTEKSEVKEPISEKKESVPEVKEPELEKKEPPPETKEPPPEAKETAPEIKEPVPEVKFEIKTEELKQEPDPKTEKNVKPLEKEPKIEEVKSQPKTELEKPVVQCEEFKSEQKLEEAKHEIKHEIIEHKTENPEVVAEPIPEEPRRENPSVFEKLKNGLKGYVSDPKNKKKIFLATATAFVVGTFFRIKARKPK